MRRISGRDAGIDLDVDRGGADVAHVFADALLGFRAERRDLLEQDRDARKLVLPRVVVVTWPMVRSELRLAWFIVTLTGVVVPAATVTSVSETGL